MQQHLPAHRLQLRPNPLRPPKSRQDRRNPSGQLPRDRNHPPRRLRPHRLRPPSRCRIRHRRRPHPPLPLRDRRHHLLRRRRPNPRALPPRHLPPSRRCVCRRRMHLPGDPRYIDGVELADSFSFNAHKWFFNNLDYKDWQIQLSRRFRAMKMWMVLRGYGVANLRRFLREHVRMAKIFEGLVRSERRFEVAVPRFFSTVCFRVRDGGDGEEGNELNRRVLERVNEEGRVCMTHAMVGGVYVMRFAVGGTLTEERPVREAWVVIKEHVEKVMGGVKN